MEIIFFVIILTVIITVLLLSSDVFTVLCNFVKSVFVLLLQKRVWWVKKNRFIQIHKKINSWEQKYIGDAHSSQRSCGDPLPARV